MTFLPATGSEELSDIPRGFRYSAKTFQFRRMREPAVQANKRQGCSQLFLDQESCAKLACVRRPERMPSEQGIRPGSNRQYFGHFVPTLREGDESL